MLFDRRRKAKSTQEDSSPAAADDQQMRRTTADTAHLIGPGCVRLVGRLPVWQPVAGGRLQLHAEYLQRVLCYGNVDFSSAVLRLLWRKGVQVVFLSTAGDRLLGKLQPAGGAPNLQRLQHLAAESSDFSVAMARDLVREKIESQLETARYYQQQGKGDKAGRLLRDLRGHLERLKTAQSTETLRGIEGTATANWFRFFASLVPRGWDFPGRRSRPATDPVNALLSLGYTLAHYRCATLLAAADLDPRVGFLHEVRAGRDSLACDLVEPLRAPLVDRLVLGLLSRKVVTDACFERVDSAYRLQRPAFKQFLQGFEQALNCRKSPPSFQEQTLARIGRWSQRIRGLRDSDEAAAGNDGP